jgi:membrane-bound lytic murein transglycosylase D
MALVRTAALLTSIFSAGITVGYGAVPARTARAMAGRMGLAGQPAAGTERPGAPSNDTGGTGESLGQESRELRALRSPEFEKFGNDRETARPQTSLPAAVCGTGAERRVCSAEEGAAEGSADTSWLVGLRAPELAVHPSVRVERFFRYLTDSSAGRKLFRSWLKRSGRYHDVVARSLRERGLPEDIEAMVFVESGYSPTAVSTEGATGLWQFMAGTGRLYGLAVDSDYDERRSVEKSTDAATRYLSDLYERFGSWELALAAYDMGYGRLTHKVQELSTNDYWTLSLVPGALPDEALAYVPKILAVALLLRNLDRFGFDEVALDSPVAASDLSVPRSTPLSLVARAAGTSVDTVRMLNPAILTANVPDRGAPLPILIPSRGLARANTMLPRLLSHWHPDETDEPVGDGFDWGVDELAPKRRMPPRPSPVWNDSQSGPSQDSADADGGDDDDRGDDTESDRRRVVVFYRVDEGDTVPSIAQHFGARAARIVADNHLDPAAKLQKGMMLKLRVPHSSVSKLVSQRPLDDGRDPPPPARPDRAPDREDSPPALGIPAPSNGGPSAPVKHLHGGHASNGLSMEGFHDLFARAKR